MIKNAQIITGIIGVSILSVSAAADPLYLHYRTNDTNAGMMSLVYPNVEECQQTTGQNCVLSAYVCGGYEFATVTTSYKLMEKLATAPNGDWLVSVGKDLAEVNATYKAAAESDFEIKLCVPESLITQDGGKE